MGCGKWKHIKEYYSKKKRKKSKHKKRKFGEYNKKRSLSIFR